MGQQDDLGLCIQLIDGVDDALLFAARIDNGGPASGLAAKNAAILLKGRHRHDGTLNHEGESRSRLKRAPARSEERRVGKEWREGGERKHERNKKRLGTGRERR